MDTLDSATAEHSQPYDSQSNGGTGTGIRAVRPVQDVKVVFGEVGRVQHACEPPTHSPAVVTHLLGP